MIRYWTEKKNTNYLFICYRHWCNDPLFHHTLSSLLIDIHLVHITLGVCNNTVQDNTVVLIHFPSGFLRCVSLKPLLVILKCLLTTVKETVINVGLAEWCLKSFLVLFLEPVGVMARTFCCPRSGINRTRSSPTSSWRIWRSSPPWGWVASVV